MAKTPGTPKPKSAAPAQFDMNSRERKGGGKGGPGGPGRGRDEKRPPSRIMNLPPTLVDRGEGWTIQKIGKIDQASHVAMGAEYHLVFEGHDPLVFEYLGGARDRAKEPPPEIAPVAEVAEVAADGAEETHAEDASAEDATAEHAPAEETPAEETPAEETPPRQSRPKRHRRTTPKRDALDCDEAAGVSHAVAQAARRCTRRRSASRTKARPGRPS